MGLFCCQAHSSAIVPSTIPIHTIVADSAEATGLKWAAPSGGGKVLQVIQGTVTGGISTSSTSYVDSNLTVNITPSSTNSKVLVFVNLIGFNPSTSQGGGMRIMRGSTEIYFSDVLNIGAANTMPANFNYLDSPSTTSQITYKAQVKSLSSSTLYTGNYYSQANPISTIIVMEIGA